MTKSDEPVTIKKYANRRLYNTGTSSYVTLEDLATMVKAGARAVMLFLVQIGSARSFALARDIDPAYGRAFDLARSAGVEAIARRCRVTQDGIEVAEAVPIGE